jgi:proline iminopeptidase
VLPDYLVDIRWSDGTLPQSVPDDKRVGAISTDVTNEGGAGASFVDAPGAKLAVYSRGATREDPVILLHGGPGVPDYLAGVAELLAPRLRVIRYDQRGTGRSVDHDGRFGLAEHLEDLEAIRAAHGFERVGLFGHSWGGTLAQLYARRHPERVAKMFLCDSGIGLGKDWKEMEKAVMAHNRSRGGKFGFALMGLYQLVSMLPGGPGDIGARRLMALVWRNYFDPPSSAPPPGVSWLEGVRSEPMHGTRRAAIEAEASLLNGIALPSCTQILILFGSDDIYGATAERLFARYPDARHVVLENTGYLPWLQNPEAFRSELCAFFDC